MHVDPLGFATTHESWSGTDIHFSWDLTDLGKRDPTPGDPANGIDGYLGETTHAWVVNVYTKPCGQGQRKVASTGLADVKYWWSVQENAAVAPEQHELHHVELYKAAYKDAFDGISWLTGVCMCAAKAECLAKLGRAMWSVADAQAVYMNHDYDCHFNPSNPKACAALPGDQKAWDDAKEKMARQVMECSKL